MYPDFRHIKTLAETWADMDFFQILDDNIDTWYPSLEIPWDYSAESLDIVYFLNASGRKPISPMLRTLLDLSETESLTDADREGIVHTVFDLYHLKWMKLWDTLEFEYSPIENYDMVETINRGKTVDDDLTHGKRVETRGNRQDNVFGFNDSGTTGTPSEKSTISNTDINSGKDQRDITEKENSTLKRHGNIGTVTAQMMVNAEREVWQWDFFKQVFKDIDSVLCLQTY